MPLQMEVEVFYADRAFTVPYSIPYQPFWRKSGCWGKVSRRRFHCSLSMHFPRFGLVLLPRWRWWCCAVLEGTGVAWNESGTFYSKVEVLQCHFNGKSGQVEKDDVTVFPWKDETPEVALNYLCWCALRVSVHRELSCAELKSCGTACFWGNECGAIRGYGKSGGTGSSQHLWHQAILGFYLAFFFLFLLWLLHLSFNKEKRGKSPANCDLWFSWQTVCDWNCN